MSIRACSTRRWGSGQPGRPPGGAVGRFLLPLSEADFALESLLEDLEVSISPP